MLEEGGQSLNGHFARRKGEYEATVLCVIIRENEMEKRKESIPVRNCERNSKSDAEILMKAKGDVIFCIKYRGWNCKRF